MLFRWFEHSQVYHPTRTMEEDPAAHRLVHENVFFKTRDGLELNGWFFPAKPNARRPHLAVLFCHGNGGNISHRVPMYRLLLNAGVNVFAFDYRGYGLSQGRAGEEGTYCDAEAAYAWLRQRGFEAKSIVVHGESLGGGIATELCLRAETAGLVLQSTFTSMPEVGAEVYPWLPVRLISTIQYNTCAKLPRIKIPVLVMHSREDGLVRFRHGETNFAAANAPKLFCELTGRHNEPVWEQPAFAEGLEKFLALIRK